MPNLDTNNLADVAAPEFTQGEPVQHITFMLRPSGIKGVGVFAVRDIPAGSMLPLFDNEEPRFVRTIDLTDPADAVAAPHFGIKEGDGYWVPRDWNKMCIGSYINHSTEPNTKNVDDVYSALRDIKAGEELTVDYRLLEAGFTEFTSDMK